VELLRSEPDGHVEMKASAPGSRGSLPARSGFSIVDLAFGAYALDPSQTEDSL
jgi:hypothetical protein